MSRRLWTTATLARPSMGRGWLRLAQLLVAIMVVGFAAFQSAHASERTPQAALAAAPDSMIVATSRDDSSDQATSSRAHVVDDFEAVDSDADPDPDPDEESGHAADFVASRPIAPHGGFASTPTILGRTAREVCSTATLVAERPARGPPTG